MPHDHAHGHAASADLGPAFRWAVGLNTGYVIAEAVAVVLTGSLALLADAARNDALANLAMIAAALVTAHLWTSAWPDLIVGLGIFYLNLNAAQAILSAARRETSHDPLP